MSGMGIDMKPGTKLASTVCGTEVIVVRPPSEPVEVSCGGSPMVPADEAPPRGGRGGERVGVSWGASPMVPADEAPPEGGRGTIEGGGDATLLGKRYVHEA